MPKKKKPKKKKVEYEDYQIEVQDWQADYSFLINKGKNFFNGVYSEYASIIVTGKILFPDLGKTKQARIDLVGDPEKDDHWQAKPSIASADSIGYTQMLRGDETLSFFAHIPMRALPHIAVTLNSSKIKYISIYGTKLKWKRGTITNISLTTVQEEE
ncbi:hypothetical protein ACFL1Z_02875 [Thermodesulfobacteriota bacterium]